MTMTMTTKASIALHRPAIVGSVTRFGRLGRRISRLVRLSTLLGLFLPVVTYAGEVSVHLWGISSPYDPPITASSGSVSGMFIKNQGSWSFRNVATASMGGLEISARENVATPQVNNNSHGSARTLASWQDAITIDAPGLTGQAGVMTLTYRVNGYVIFEGTYDQVAQYNQARVTNTVTIDNDPAHSWAYGIDNTGPQGQNHLNTDHVIQWGFTFGTPFTVKHMLAAYTAVDARNGEGKRAEVEVAGVWKGITVAYQGSPVTNATTSVIVGSLSVPFTVTSISPTVPAGLAATPASETQINLSWTASTDNVGVTGYKVYRNSVLVGSPTTTNYSNTGLTASTTYSYTVAACDAAGNCSAQSSAVSATTQAAIGSTLNLVSSWNLLGNSVSAPLNVTTAFGSATNVSTVWKWIPATSKWAFYTPTIPDGGAAYAATKGYDFLTSINAGEGFWVNAKVAFTASLPAGTAVTTADFADQQSPPNKLPPSWSLIAVGDNPTPRTFANGIALTPPSAGTLAAMSLTTLWAWHPGSAEVQPGWYFYAPSLDNSGGLTSYITSKGYLDFTAAGKTLDSTTGFWVNHP